MQHPTVQLVVVGMCSAGAAILLLFPALFLKLVLFIYHFYY